MSRSHFSSRRSEPGIDIFRGLAVVLMFLAHAWRLQDGRAPDGIFSYFDIFLAWLDRGVAFVAACFLFIAGFSLVLAYQQKKTSPFSFFRGVWRKAAWLYLLSLLLFLPEYGLEFPDLFVSSGILSVIAMALVLTASGLVSPRSEVVLGSMSVAVLAITWVLENKGWVVTGMNAGPGGAIPLLGFSTLGALMGHLYLRKGIKVIFAAAFLTLPLFLVGLSMPVPWLALYSSEYQDHGGLAITHLLRLSSPTQESMTRVFWNPSAVGFLGLVFPVVLCCALLLSQQNRIADHKTFRPLMLLGRHALLVFVAHYGLIGLIDLLGLRPPHGGWTLVLFLFLVVVDTVFCMAQEHHQKKSRKALKTA